ncbi:MAG: histidine kinase [Acidobacteria bacterium]|nr:histidine kinase [Acidobacteriota bacterium]
MRLPGCQKNLGLKRLSFCTLYILCFVLFTQAQYRFDSWTTDEGLPQNSVYSIAQTSDGYLWFTTLDGLVRFDGVKFTVFNKGNSPNLNTNRLKYVFADGNSLWIGTENGGLIRYLNGEFRTFTAADGLPSNDVNEVQKDADGSLVIVMVNGIARTRDQGVSLKLERAGDVREYKIFYGASGTRWELNKNGLQISRNGSTENYPLPFDAQRIVADPVFNSFSSIPVFEDRRGALWFAAAGNLYRFQNGEFATFTVENGMPSSRVRTIAEDAAGDAWFGTEKDGACRLAANRVACFGIADGLSSNHVMNIFLDRENTVWIGTNNAGINRVSKQIVTPLSIADGLLDKNVYPILQTRTGDVWIGTTSALSLFQNGKITNYTERDDLPYPTAQALFEDGDGRLWGAFVGIISYMENGKFVEFNQTLGLPAVDLDVWDVHQTRAGAMWFGTNRGLYKYENGRTTKFTTENGLPDIDVKAILETSGGALWIATYGGIARLKDNGFVAYTERDGLAGNFVRSIYEDAEGLLWFGTYDSGLSLFRNGAFTNFNVNNGLFSDGVFAILPDARGNFWMSSNQGIYRVNRQQLVDFADGKISSIVSTAFGKSDGMLNAECNGGRQPAGIRAADGRLWFPTQDGVAIIDPEAVTSNPLPPPVVIESVKIDNVLSEPSASEDGFSKFTIQPNQNNLGIQYTGLSFIKPEHIQFRYRLEGLDKDWTNAGTRREVYYPYLPPGKYTFRVIAANSDNVWNEQGAAIEIVVLPPFYRTAWFIGLTIFGLALIGFVLYKRRISELKRKQTAQEEFSRSLINAQETERRRIAAELHDSLGQSLAMIKNSAVFGEQAAADLPTAKEQLAQITAQSAHAISEVREIAYNLRPYLLDRLGLTKAIRSMLNKVADSSAFNLVYEVDNVDELFPNEAEINIYRIIQESLNNIIKHAEASEVKVSVKKIERALLIEIEDNGKGFDIQDENRGGFGLLGMTERVRILGGTLSVQSVIGKGTKIVIKLTRK